MTFDIKKGVDTLKGLVETINDKALVSSDELVDNGLEAAQNWQKVAAKALKTGTVLFGKQQDLLFYTLEGVKNTSLSGAARLSHLLNITLPVAPKATRIMQQKEVAQVAKVSKKAIAKITKKVEKKTKATVAKTTKKAVKTVTKVVGTVTQKAANTAAKATKIADARIAKATTKKAITTKPVAKKVVAKIVATKNVTTKNDDLKVIDGIGPKMESILNKAGFISFAQLAKANDKAIKTILLAENPRFKMFEPKEWIKEAITLAKK